MTLVVAISALALWQGSAAYTHWQLTQLIPSSVQQRVSFPIFLPEAAKTTIKQSSFSYTNNVLQFEITINGTLVTVAEQAKTSDFNLSNFTKSDGITDVKTITVSNGNALFGTVGPLKVGILETEKTIVTLSTTGAITTDELETVTRSLQQL